MASNSLASGGRKPPVLVSGSNGGLTPPARQERPKIIAVLMTYNCARLVPKAYQQIPLHLVDEVLATDDGSRDGSHEAAVELGIPAFRHTPNRGYGGNLKEGIRLALARGADYIVEVHGDGQFHPRALELAYPLILEGYEFIIGSRFMIPGRARENGMPLIRWTANRGLSLIDRAVLGLPFSEFHTGFRIYSRKLLQRVAWEDNADNYLFSFQIIAQAAYARARAAEVPVEADYRGDHTSHSLRGASVYAVRTFEVLGQYVLARSGLYHPRIFPRSEAKVESGKRKAESRKGKADSGAETTAAIACRGCGQPALSRMFSLGNVPGVNAFFTPEEVGRERPYPLDVAWCRECTLVQLESIVPPGELFSHYQHLSSASQSNVRHLGELAALLTSRLGISQQSKVLEIGSNDGTLLSAIKGASQADVLGVDPARNLAEYAQQKGVDQISDFFTPELADKIVAERGARDLVVALNVVAHTPDVSSLLNGIARVLAPGGTFVMEAVHVMRTILHGEFDTVYHEHVYCFSLTALVPLLRRAGLTVVDVEEIPTQGGSLRVYARRSDSRPVAADSVAKLLQTEAGEGVRDPATYQSVGDRVRQFKVDLLARLKELRQSHGRVFGLGAPARGVVILNYCGIGPELLDAVVDDTPLKQGRLVPGVHIPVVDWNAVERDKPGGYLVLSWNYEREILDKLRRHVSAAEVLVPFPELRTVTS
ncbi:MAG: methyltransferase domain-containing protein [Planctomycetes bacterium]|nr:methyltransferase domain-containing protein [Planctomycetota bacterium]